MNLHAKWSAGGSRTLTPALCHPMGEGDFITSLRAGRGFVFKEQFMVSMCDLMNRGGLP